MKLGIPSRALQIHHWNGNQDEVEIEVKSKSKKPSEWTRERGQALIRAVAKSKSDSGATRQQPRWKLVIPTLEGEFSGDFKWTERKCRYHRIVWLNFKGKLGYGNRMKRSLLSRNLTLKHSGHLLPKFSIIHHGRTQRANTGHIRQPSGPSMHNATGRVAYLRQGH